MQRKGFLVGACTALVFSAQALAEPPRIIAPGTGEDLGALSSNPYDPNSVSNPYKPDSVINPSATEKPALVNPDTGKYLGKASSNPYDPDLISNP